MTGVKLTGALKYRVIRIPGKTIVQLFMQHGNTPAFWAGLKTESARRGLIYSHVVEKWDHLIEVGPRIKAWWEDGEFCQINYDVLSGRSENGSGLSDAVCRETKGGGRVAEDLASDVIDGVLRTGE